MGGLVPFPNPPSLTAAPPCLFSRHLIPEVDLCHQPVEVLLCDPSGLKALMKVIVILP